MLFLVNVSASWASFAYVLVILFVALALGKASRSVGASVLGFILISGGLSLFTKQLEILHAFPETLLVLNSLVFYPLVDIVKTLLGSFGLNSFADSANNVKYVTLAVVGVLWILSLLLGFSGKPKIHGDEVVKEGSKASRVIGAIITLALVAGVGFLTYTGYVRANQDVESTALTEDSEIVEDEGGEVDDGEGGEVDDGEGGEVDDGEGAKIIHCDGFDIVY